jgi:hypothetical protein
MKTITTDRILLAMIEHGSQERAAEALGISPTTIFRRLQKPEVRERYRAMRREAFLGNKGTMMRAARSAVTVLENILRDQGESAAIRARAAQSIFKHADKFRLEDFQARADKLERIRNDDLEQAELPLHEAREGEGIRRKTKAGAAATARIVAALIKHGTQARAAAFLGISLTTLWRRSKTPEFKKQWAAAEREEYSQVMARLQYAARSATFTLLSLLNDKRGSAASRVRVANYVLECCGAYASEDVRARLGDLEPVLKDRAA